MARRYSQDAIKFRQALLELSAALEAQHTHGLDRKSECMSADQSACFLHRGLLRDAQDRAKALLAEKWEAPVLKSAK